MAVTAFWYKAGLDSVFTKKIDILNDALKMMVVTTTYTPSQDTHDFKNDVTGEVTGTGYVAGGLALAGVALAYNAGTNVWSITCNPIAWGTVTFVNGRYGIIYDSTPATDATRPLISYVDFGANQSPTAAPFTVTPAATGIGYIAIA